MGDHFYFIGHLGLVTCHDHIPVVCGDGSCGSIVFIQAQGGGGMMEDRKIKEKIRTDLDQVFEHLDEAHRIIFGSDGRIGPDMIAKLELAKKKIDELKEDILIVSKTGNTNSKVKVYDVEDDDEHQKFLGI